MSEFSSRAARREKSDGDNGAVGEAWNVLTIRLEFVVSKPADD